MKASFYRSLACFFYPLQLWLFRPVSVMARSETVVIEAYIIEDYKQRIREHFGISPVLDTTRCLACREPSTSSEAGEKQHEATGICEACGELLLSESDQRSRIIRRCTRLRDDDAMTYVAMWMYIHTLEPANSGFFFCWERWAEHMVAVGRDGQQLPNFLFHSNMQGSNVS